VVDQVCSLVETAVQLDLGSLPSSLFFYPFRLVDLYLHSLDSSSGIYAHDLRDCQYADYTARCSSIPTLYVCILSATMYTAGVLPGMYVHLLYGVPFDVAVFLGHRALG